MADEQLDLGDEVYVGSDSMQYHGGGAIHEDDLINDDDEYDDLYNDVNVGEGFKHMQMSDPPLATAGVDNGSFRAPKPNFPEDTPEPKVTQLVNNPGIPKLSIGLAVNKGPPLAIDSSLKGRAPDAAHNAQAESLGYQSSLSVPQNVALDSFDMSRKIQGEPVPVMNSGPSRVVSQMGSNQITPNASYNRPLVSENQVRPAVDNGNTMLFVGELHWWTTDAEIESVLTRYGRVKELKFFDERASGKSKGYCQVEFFESGAAAACKEGMNGHLFNGRACVVAFATPQTIKQISASYMNKTAVQAPPPQPQGRRPGNDAGGRGNGTNYPSGDSGRNFGRGGWGGRGGQGGQGFPNKGPGGGPGRGRGGPMGARNFVDNNLGANNGAIGGGPYGQGLAGHAFGGPPAGLVHPQAMMGPGFDPGYMGRGVGYGGFSGPAFTGMMPPYQALNPMGLHGVAPHVNPAFFGRGMPSNGMGMMGTAGMEGPHTSMWTDNNTAGWGGEDQGRRTRESSYNGDDNASEYEGSQDKGVRSGSASRVKDRGSGSSDRRNHEDREPDRERYEGDRRYREDKDSYRDNRHKERDSGYGDDWDRGQASRSRPVPEDHRRSRSRDADYGKRRRPSE